MAKRKPVPHVGLIDRGRIFCFHCGDARVLIPPEGLRISPKSMRAMTLMSEDFEDQHRRCVESDSSPTRRTYANAHHWFQDSGDTGLSSCTIVNVITGDATRDGLGPTPRDPADFGRCYRVLRHLAGWRPNLTRAQILARVAERYPNWAPLVAAWDDLTALFEEEVPNHWTGPAPKLYDRMLEFRDHA